MVMGLLGRKVGMTQIFDEKGKLAPVTVLMLGPCPVLQLRTLERDGYHAVEVGFEQGTQQGHSLRAWPCGGGLRLQTPAAIAGER